MLQRKKLFLKFGKKDGSIMRYSGFYRKVKFIQFVDEMSKGVYSWISKNDTQESVIKSKDIQLMFGGDITVQNKTR